MKIYDVWIKFNSKWLLLAGGVCAENTWDAHIRARKKYSLDKIFKVKVKLRNLK